MEIAKYFATLGIKVLDKDTKAVDKFLNKFEKDLKTSAKSTDTLEKAVKKETKTTVDGLVQKEQKQKALNKQITVAAKNQKAWNKEFAYSIKLLNPNTKPLSIAALKRQQKEYNQVFGAFDPITAKGSNKKAWHNKLKQQVSMLLGEGQGSGISRRVRQEQLEAAFSPGRNHKLANMLHQRTSHLVGKDGQKSDTLADMAAHYRNEEKISALKERTRREEEASANRILALHKREQERRIVNTARLAKIEERAAAKVATIKQKALPAPSTSTMSHIGSFTGHVASNRFGMGLGFLPGPALAAAAPFAGAAIVQQGSVALGNNQALRERQRVQLDIASGANNRAARDAANAKFFALSNQLGIEAEPMVDPYAKFMKQMTSMGKTPEVAFDVYKNMSLATRAAGGGQLQMERQAYALQQIMGLGWAQSDELNKQLVDANPSIKKYIIDEYVAKTGKPRNTFEKAISNREITTDIITSAYQTAAVAGQGRVQEFSSTVQAEQARLANMMLEEQMARTLTDEVLPSMREYVKAQTEMYEAMKPFRDSLYEASASVLSFSAAALNFAAPYTAQAGQLTRNNPTLKSITTNPAWFIPDNPVTMALKYGMIGKDAYNAYTAEPAPTQRGIDFLRQSKEGFMQGGQTQVMVQPGAFVIHTQASDPEEVGKLTTQWFKTQLELTLQANPQKE